MPALTLYGRRWHTTTDMLPLPATLFAIMYLVWLIVFSVVISHLQVWKPCSGQGVHYMVTTAALIGVYGASALCQGGLIFFGLQGTCFEISKRRPVAGCLYVQSLVWVLQAVFMVYGTIILYVADASCWSNPRDYKNMRGLTEAMVWSTWGMAAFLWITVYLVYNSYQGHESRTAWEKRVKNISWLLGCRGAVASSDGERGEPVTDIAQWISGLFAHVDLSVTDITEALILTAAAQSLRRKMRIKKVLAPRLPALSTAGTEVTSDTSSLADVEELSSIISTEDDDDDPDTDDEGQQAGNGTKAEKAPGALEHPKPDGGDTVALPEDYPKDWSSMADQRYSQTATQLQSSSNPTHASPDQLPSITDADLEPREWPGPDDEDAAEPLSQVDGAPDSPAQRGRLKGGSDIETLQEESGSQPDGAEEEVKSRRRSGAGATPATSAVVGSSQHSVAGTDPGDATLHSDSRNSSGTQTPGSSEMSLTDSSVSLSKVDPKMLKSFEESSRTGEEQLPPTPKERFGIGKKNKKGRPAPQKQRQDPADEARRALDELGRTQNGSAGSPQQSSAGRQQASSRAATSKHSAGDPSLPSSLAGKLQSGLNEPDGGLPSADLGGMSRAFTFDSSLPATAAGTRQTSLEVTASDLAAHEGEEIISRAGTGEEQVIPLERQISNRFPTVITPSEQVAAEVAHHDVPITAAINEAIGERTPVEYEMLNEAAHWARFATAVYAIMPFSQSGRLRRYTNHCFVCTEAVTEESVRDNILDLTGIDAADLLYFSHSNIALSHLPYMVALDRGKKTVVVAIRGTVSLADLVTDAVVHPEPLHDWLSAATRKVKRKAAAGNKKAYGHAGIVSAARGVLEDLEAHGILHTLLQPEDTRKSLEMSRSQEGTNGWKHAPCKGAHKEQHAAEANGRPGGDDSENIGADQEKVGGGLRRDTQGAQSGGVWPSESLRPGQGRESGETRGEQDTREQRNEMASAARDAEGTTQEQGEATGAALRKNLDTKGWKLVVTGHSLGAGAAALISLKIHDRYPEMKCWAFSPPGGLVSRSLVGFMEEFCTSVVVGKDAVPRMSVNNLNRLMDEMVTSLARCRYHKLRVLLGRWWHKESRPPPQHLFHSYRTIPLEARLVLERYYKSAERKGRAMDMYPPGRVMFLRPIKLQEEMDEEEGGGGKRLRQAWDAVWITPQELMMEGILVSKKMLSHHLIQSTLIDAVGYAIRHHPDNPKPEAEKQMDREEQKSMQSDLQEIRVDNEGPGPFDLLSSTSPPSAEGSRHE